MLALFGLSFQTLHYLLLDFLAVQFNLIFLLNVRDDLVDILFNLV